MTTTALDLTTIEPFDRRAATEFGRIEYHRFIDALERLEPADWNRQTDCEGWTVRDLAGHLAGSMHSQSSMRNTIGEVRAVKRRAKETGESEVDAMSALQVESVADLDTVQLIEQMRSNADRAARGRGRPPGFVVKLAKIPVDLGTIKETWTLDYLLGTILTRDTWLHRVADLARAVDHEPVLDADHDGLIVADIAAEWCRRHGQSVDLFLTGPAGGHYVYGDSGVDVPRIEIDAIEFCRILSERAEPSHELLTTPVPF